MGYDIQIIPCPIVRETDGLAMSSRNLLLSSKERQVAPYISQVLFKAKELKDRYSPEALIAWVKEEISREASLRLEYFDIVDDQELKRIENWSEPTNKVGCIAVYLGRIRLIDAIIFD
jgi:pantoate--beta-alanine ligase